MQGRMLGGSNSIRMVRKASGRFLIDPILQNLACFSGFLTQEGPPNVWNGCFGCGEGPWDRQGWPHHPSRTSIWSRWPPILLDFVDGGHLDGEDDILERWVLSKSCLYNGVGCPEHQSPWSGWPHVLLDSTTRLRGRGASWQGRWHFMKMSAKQKLFVLWRWVS